MSDIELHAVVNGILVPGAITLIALLAAWRPWRRDTPVEHGHWGGAIGFAVAYAAGHALVLERVPELPPGQVEDWVWIFALLAGVLGPAMAGWRPPWWAACLAALLIGAVQARLILGELAAPPWDEAWVGPAIWIGAGVATLGAYWSFDTLALRAPGGTVPACLWAALAGSALLIMEYAFASGMQLAGVMASACAVAAVVGWWRPRVTMARGGVLVAMVVFSGLWLVTVLFAQEVRLWAAALAFASPHAAWAGDLPGIRRLRPWQRGLIRLAAVGALVGVALALGRPPADPLDELYGDF